MNAMCHEVNNMPIFKRWFLEKFKTPESVCAHYLHSLEEVAASIGASLPSDFLDKMQLTTSKNGKHIYLPDQKGQRIKKHYYTAFLGETGLQEKVEIPILSFKSYRLPGYTTWSPAKLLWQDFKNEKRVNGNKTSQAEVDNRYEESLKQIKERSKILEEQYAILTTEAQKAAAKLALTQLGKNFSKRVTDPSYWFGINGLEPRPEAEYECYRSASGRVYIKDTESWETRFGAQCRDMLIPVYNSKGALSTIQKITPSQFGSAKKTFIPFSETQGCFTIVSKDINPNLFVIGEGYKTVRVYDHANTFRDIKFTAICAFSANNLPSVAQLLCSQYPDAIILFAEDNDETGRYYAKKGQETIGSKFPPIPAPNLFKGSDWADLCRHNSINEVAMKFNEALDSILSLGSK